jgi:broad specificity phosphatase PhoE
VSIHAVPAALHLVRHGAVENPDHVVYAGLPGFGLSDLGWRQAEAAAAYLAEVDVVLIVASPLQRAVETAAAIAAPHRLAVPTDPRLREWDLGNRWEGRSWESLPALFPGELDAYLENPEDLPFSSEPLADLAVRVAEVAEEIWEAQPRPGHVVLVTHQDPIEAGRRRLCGRGFESFHVGKPDHAVVVSLFPEGERWQEIAVWSPNDE